MHSTVRLDVSDSAVEKLKIGQEVRAEIRGTIKSLHKRETFENSTILSDVSEVDNSFPAEAVIDISSVKVKVPNAFSELAEDSDEDD